MTINIMNIMSPQNTESSPSGRDQKKLTEADK